MDFFFFLGKCNQTHTREILHGVNSYNLQINLQISFGNSCCRSVLINTADRFIGVGECSTVLMKISLVWRPWSLTPDFGRMGRWNKLFVDQGVSEEDIHDHVRSNWHFGPLPVRFLVFIWAYVMDAPNFTIQTSRTSNHALRPLQKQNIFLPDFYLEKLNSGEIFSERSGGGGGGGGWKMSSSAINSLLFKSQRIILFDYQ